MPDHTARINEIREILRTGITSSVVDGTAITIDPESLRHELRNLMQEDDTQRRRRPRISTINNRGLTFDY